MSSEINTRSNIGKYFSSLLLAIGMCIFVTIYSYQIVQSITGYKNGLRFYHDPVHALFAQSANWLFSIVSASVPMALYLNAKKQHVYIFLLMGFLIFVSGLVVFNAKVKTGFTQFAVRDIVYIIASGLILHGSMAVPVKTLIIALLGLGVPLFYYYIPNYFGPFRYFLITETAAVVMVIIYWTILIMAGYRSR